METEAIVQSHEVMGETIVIAREIPETIAGFTIITVSFWPLPFVQIEIIVVIITAAVLRCTRPPAWDNSRGAIDIPSCSSRRSFSDGRAKKYPARIAIAINKKHVNKP